jgi:DNA-binding NarL/FixJ family response regulator
MSRSRGIFFILLLIAMTVIILIDLVFDTWHGASTWHIVVESVVILLSLTGIVYLLLNLKKQAEALRSLSSELEDARKKVSAADKQMREARSQYSKVIAGQFSSWELTTSEQEIAWLLLKGLSFREIAELRQTREKTVRQQASEIYKKANVEGRHAFSAWFFEDILE